MPEQTDPFAYGTAITEGHPLWAYTEAIDIIGSALAQAMGEGESTPRTQDAARALLARLAQHEPSLLVVTQSEIKDTGDDAIERSAKAWHEWRLEVKGLSDHEGSSWENMDEPYRESVRKGARRAQEAM